MSPAVAQAHSAASGKAGLATPACSASRRDEPQVHLEWLTRLYNIFEPDQVEMCRQAFSNLLSASVKGEQAEAIIQRALEGLR
jgi:hypothetical protein